jgi:hypothetical protein
MPSDGEGLGDRRKWVRCEATGLHPCSDTLCWTTMDGSWAWSLCPNPPVHSVAQSLDEMTDIIVRLVAEMRTASLRRAAVISVPQSTHDSAQLSQP